MTDNTPRTSALVPFSFTYKNHPLRVEKDADGEPLFHVGDLCAILGHTNPSQAIRQHVDACDLTKREVIDSLGRIQVANFVTEPGMWALILSSHAENAKPVKRWVTAEVLPAIRKTGSYTAPGATAYQDPSLVTIRRDDLNQLMLGLSIMQTVVDRGMQAVAAIERAAAVNFPPAQPTADQSNAKACLAFILSAPLLVAAERWYGEASTRELIGVVRGQASRGIPDLDAVRTLARYGLRLEGEYLLVSNTNKDLAGVLRGTKWAVAWRKTLIQLQGSCKRAPVKIGSHVSRCVAVPLGRLGGAI